MGLLDGKVALITGAARGQGRAHAVTCAREGADVIVIDINEQLSTVAYPMSVADDLAETVAQVEALDRRAVSLTADVRDQAQLDEAVARGTSELGQVDILIANAGIWTMGPIWEITDEQWDQVVDTNLKGVWHSIKAVMPHMIERETGSIVLTSSVNGLEPGDGWSHYVASKYGVIGLMKSVALEGARYGIRCNAICPGSILTGMTNHQGFWDMFAGHAGGTEQDLLNAGRHFAALKGTTWLDPQVIADTGLYLNSDLAAYVTGVAIPVDAGHLLMPGVNAHPQISERG